MSKRTTKQRRAARRRRVIQGLGPGCWLIVNKQLRTEVIERAGTNWAMRDVCEELEEAEERFGA